jgi:hypothetical protein
MVFSTFIYIWQVFGSCETDRGGAVMVVYGRRKEIGGRVFLELELGRGRHLSVPVRLCLPGDVSGSFVKLFETGGCEVKFPMVGWSLKQVRDGLFVARRDVVSMVCIYECRAGYRGSGSVEILSPEGLFHVKYPLYASERGSLGVGEGVIFAAPVECEVVLRWNRSGRLYGSPGSGLVGIRKSGVAWEVAGISDLSELEALRNC